jgi:hypothetical protein
MRSFNLNKFVSSNDTFEKEKYTVHFLPTAAQRKKHYSTSSVPSPFLFHIRNPKIFGCLRPLQNIGPNSLKVTAKQLNHCFMLRAALWTKTKLLMLIVVCLQDGLAMSISQPSYTKTSVNGNVTTR